MRCARVPCNRQTAVMLDPLGAIWSEALKRSQWVVRVSVLGAEGLDTSGSRDIIKFKWQEHFLTFWYPWNIDLFGFLTIYFKRNLSQNHNCALLREKNYYFSFTRCLLTSVINVICYFEMKYCAMGIVYIINHRGINKNKLEFKIEGIPEKQHSN